MPQTHSRPNAQYSRPSLWSTPTIIVGMIVAACLFIMIVYLTTSTGVPLVTRISAVTFLVCSFCANIVIGLNNRGQRIAKKLWTSPGFYVPTALLLMISFLITCITFIAR